MEDTEFTRETAPGFILYREPFKYHCSFTEADGKQCLTTARYAIRFRGEEWAGDAACEEHVKIVGDIQQWS